MPKTSPTVLTPAEAAKFLRSNARTLERWRYLGDGPIFVKIGRRVAYRQEDLEAFLMTRRRIHAGQDGAVR